MRRTKKEAEDSRKRIIDTAYKVFLKKGFAATKLSDIADEIKMTRGVIYWHFKNKTDLFVCLLNDVLDEAMSYNVEIFKSNESLPNKLKKLLMTDGTGSRLFELLKSFHPASIHLDRKSRQEAAQAIKPKIQAVFNSFVDFLSNEQKAGNIKKNIDIQMFARTYMMISSMLHVSNLKKDKMPMLSIPKNKRDTIIDFFWNGFNSAFPKTP
jgi:AcrR family transcriptional regulator